MSSSRSLRIRRSLFITLWAIIFIGNTFGLAPAASLTQLPVRTRLPARSLPAVAPAFTNAQVQPAATEPGAPVLITSYSDLPPERDGMVVKCQNCQQTNPCTPGGTGAWAFGSNGQFQCIDSTPPGMDNVLDFGAFPSLYRMQCAVQPGQSQIVCNGIANGDFAVSQDIVLYGAGIVPTVGQPTGFTATPVTTTGFAVNHDTRLAPGCTVHNAFAWCDTGSAVCGISNMTFYEQGQNLSIEGAGPAGAPLSAQILEMDYASDTITLSQAVSTTVSGAAITGANCSTTRNYQAYPIDANGGWGTPTSVLTVNTSASSLNWGSFVDVQVNVPQPLILPDNVPLYPLPSNIPIAWAFYCSEGTDPLQLCGVEVPTFSFNSNSLLPAPWNDNLLGGTQKGFPTVVTFHDTGRPYGHDLIEGTSPPGNAVDDMVFGRIVAVNDDTVTFELTGNSPIAQSGMVTMGHDGGPAVNRAIQAACNPEDGACGTVYFPNMPNSFPVASSIVALRGSGLILLGTNGPAVAEPDSGAGSGLLWTGALGGTLLTFNQETKPVIDSLSLQAYLGTTMGVSIDIDEWDSDGLGVVVTTTEPTLRNIYTGQASVGARFANINPSNVEFGTVDSSVINWVYGSTYTSGSGIGLIINSWNSLGTSLYSSTIGGEIGVLNNSGGFLDEDSPLGAPDGISIWIGGGDSHPITIDGVIIEHLERFIFSPNLGSPSADVQLSITQSMFTDIQVPNDGAFISLTGGGATELQNNNFIFPAVGWNSDFSTNLYPQGIVFPGQLSSISAQGNIWSDNCDDPYGELRSTNNPINATSELCLGVSGNLQLIPLYAPKSSSPTATPSATPTISPTTVPTNTETPSPTPTVVAGRLVVLPRSLRLPTEVFANETSTSAPRDVTLTNRGLFSISLFGTSVTGAALSDFRIQSSGSTCGQTLAPKQRCIYKMVFQPTAVGNRTAVLNISDNLASSPQSVALSGRAKP
jgi:hypothetical protein